LETKISWIYDLVMASYVENESFLQRFARRTLQAEIADRSQQTHMLHSITLSHHPNIPNCLTPLSPSDVVHNKDVCIS